eukprot:gene3091-3636_t
MASGGQEPIKTFLRIRPQDSTIQGDPCLKALSTKTAALIDPTGYGDKLKFEFDHVFDDGAPQEDVFQVSCKNLVYNLFHGYDSLFFAFGVTASGKTHTVHGSDTQPGVVCRTLHLVYEVCRLIKDPSAGAKECARAGIDMATLQEFRDRLSGDEYTVGVGLLEVYNEPVTDVLRDQ